MFSKFLACDIAKAAYSTICDELLNGEVTVYIVIQRSLETLSVNRWMALRVCGDSFDDLSAVCLRTNLLFFKTVASLRASIGSALRFLKRRNIKILS